MSNTTDPLEASTARAARQDLVKLLLVLGEDHPGSGIHCEIFHWAAESVIDAR